MNDAPGVLDSLSDEIHRLRQILDLVGAYVYTKDTAGRYTYANAMVCALFADTLDEVLGKTDENFFDLSVSDDLRQNDLRVLKHGERIETEERNIIAATGEERIYWAVKQPIRDAAGTIVGLCGISTDVTERRHLETELERQKNLLSVVLENVDAFVYMKDRDRRYRYVNGRTAELYRMKAEDIVGRNAEDLLPRETTMNTSILDRQVFQSGEKASGEELIRAPDGREMHCWSTKIPLFRNGEIDGLIGFSTDISELVKLKNRFYELARIDTLTGVLTRRFLLDHAETILKRTQRRSGRMALLMIDLDRFKEINDTYGHAFGDAYLVAVVEACRRTLRDGDLMGRLGGDEFVIVLDDIDDTGLRAVAARFRNAVRASAISAPDGTTLHPSISIGTAISDPASTVDSLLVAADAALYREKGDGKDAPRHGEC